MAVLIGVADAQQCAGVEPDATGPLDLEEEQFDGVIHPGQLATGRCAAPGIDVGPAEIRHQLAADQAPANPHSLELRIQLGEVDHDQVIGYRIQGMPIALVAGAAAVQEWFVIAGEQAFGTAIARDDLTRFECRLEIAALGGGIGARRRLGADCGPFRFGS